MRVSLSAMGDKTDGNYARGIAQMMRLDWFRAVHVKTGENQQLRTLLVNQRLPKRELIDIENEVRRMVKAFGIRLGSGFGHAAFAKRVRVAHTGDDLPAGLTKCMLRAWAVLWEG